jgi:hypothetical protein
MIFSIGQTTASSLDLSETSSKDSFVECIINNYRIYTYKEAPSSLVISPGVFIAAALSLFSRGVALNVNNLCINWR